MERVRRILSGLLAVCLSVAVMGPLTVYGAASAINSVNIRVGLNDFEPGDKLPEIVVGSKDTGETAYVYTSSDYYLVEKAEWVTSTSKTVQVGDTPRMKVWLEPSDYTNRRFKGGYQSSNVKITGGTFKSASIVSRDLVVTLELDPVKGQYEAPEEAYWSGNGYGNARWKMDGSLGGSYQYEIALYRGSSQVYKTTVSTTSYNFYPYMTKKGTYHFRVRVVPGDGNRYGKSSEWARSDEINLPEEAVSDGSGQGGGQTASGNTQQVGWIQRGSRWYFLYPDGSYPKDEWLSRNGKWYLFDAEGWMVTGWQSRNGHDYYMDASGAMVTGWLKTDNGVYYLNPTPDQFEGILVKSRWIQDSGGQFYLDQNGMRTEGWMQVDGNWYYFYPGTGIKAVSTTISGFVLDADGVWHK